MSYYSFNRPRRDGRLSWPCWLTDSGRLTHKVVTRPAISLAQDRESSPARTGGLTTMLRHQNQSQNQQQPIVKYSKRRCIIDPPNPFCVTALPCKILIVILVVFHCCFLWQYLHQFLFKFHNFSNNHIWHTLLTTFVFANVGNSSKLGRWCIDVYARW